MPGFIPGFQASGTTFRNLDRRNKSGNDSN